MEMTDLLTPDSVIDGLKVTSKKQVLQDLSERAAKLTGLDTREVLDTILARERLGTTGVGQGIAIPHGRMENLDKIYGLFARLNKPVDFDSLDEKPVDLVFMLLAPDGAGADHLKALAKISRLLRNKTICNKLRGSDSSDALFALLT